MLFFAVVVKVVVGASVVDVSNSDGDAVVVNTGVVIIAVPLAAAVESTNAVGFELG